MPTLTSINVYGANKTATATAPNATNNLAIPATGLSVQDGTNFKVINITLSATVTAAGVITGAPLIVKYAKVDVLWTEEGGEPNTAVGGTITNIDATKGTIEITGLALKGKFQFQFFGVVEIDDPKIGPVRGLPKIKKAKATEGGDEKVIAELVKAITAAKDTEPTKGAILAANTKENLAARLLGSSAARISVRIGNMNAEGDWIIDFSDKQAKDGGSSINVGGLIEWIKDKNSESGAPLNEDNPSLPEGEGLTMKDKTGKDVGLEQIKDYEITFEDFWFNLTKKIFKIDVKSGPDQELTLGAFTIKEIGFSLTNQPSDGDYAKLLPPSTDAADTTA